MSTDSNNGDLERPTREVSFTLNGEEVSAEVEPRLKLSDFLRNYEGLRGVRVGCEHGVCGACTVLKDGASVKSCLMYAVQADGADVTTPEGLSVDGALGPLQKAFNEEHALQCGFCTGGFLMASTELLENNPSPSREDVKEGLADNICRCTGYHNIYRAVEKAADEMGED